MTFSPPIGFADPCFAMAVVRPPASWRYIATLLCVSTSAIRTSGTIAKPLSLTAVRLEWMCGSMRPGVTCFPVPSITTAPDGAVRFGPTSAT